MGVEVLPSGSGPLAPPKAGTATTSVADYDVADFFQADYCYVRDEGYPQIASLHQAWRRMAYPGERMGSKATPGTGFRSMPGTAGDFQSQAVGW